MNRARKLEALRLLQSLLAEALDGGFSGTIAVEVAAKNGNLGPVKHTRVQWSD